MEIGEPKKVHEIRPVTEPVPEELPLTEPLPIEEPSEPALVPERV